MCGITGYWNPAGFNNDSQQALKPMIQIMCHRGPDGIGEHIDPRRGLALGHSRLSIIDLHTGAQPLRSEDGSLTLVANGEFYDYKRLRSLLMARGHRFKTKSDSEIALGLFKEEGIQCLRHLRGEFAFALHDQREECLYLVRDRFGIKPLFYTEVNGQLIFGSEIKCLLAHPDVKAGFDPRAVIHQLMQVMVPGTSAFKGIKAVKPGHYLKVYQEGGRLRIENHRYWDMEFPTLDERRSSDGEAADSIRTVQEKLAEAVALRLEADVPVGCYLSGGIDSCSILGLASGAQQSAVKAFTISFDNDEYDEASIAREMAASVGAEQDILNLTADELYGENYAKVAFHAERTFYNTLGVAKWCMSKHVYESGYKTVVTGEGADELFGGYPFFKKDMFLHGINDEPEDIRAGLRKALDETNALFKGAILAENDLVHPAFVDLMGFTPSWIQPWMATLELARPLLSKDYQDATADYDPIAAIAETLDPSKIEGRHPLDKVQYTWSRTMLEGQILNWGGDRVDMANSMESRPAFLDHHLAEAALRIPPNQRIRGNTEKWVLREAMKGILPEVLYKRQKFAFMAPPAHTDPKKMKHVKRIWDQYCNPDAIRAAGIFDETALNEFLKSYETGADRVNLTRQDALLNHIMGLQILHQKFIEG